MKYEGLEMNLPKLFFTISLLLFGSIGILAVMKRSEKEYIHKDPAHLTYEKGQQGDSSSGVPTPKADSSNTLQEVDLSSLQALHSRQGASLGKGAAAQVAHSLSQFDDDSVGLQKDESSQEKSSSQPVVIEHDDIQDSIKVLFEKPSRCPIVETVRYTSRVSWKPKKSAWLVDYAHHYKTPLEFIYRSLNGPILTANGQVAGYSEKPVTVSEGTEFNVFRKDINFHFYIVVSFASSKLRLYYILPEEKKAVFLKSYPICLGRKDGGKASGSLTPFGLYQLGLKVASFQPNMMGPYKGKQVEMIQVFGTRWMPFEREVDQKACTEPAKGFGIHGTPMRRMPDGKIVEDASSIGKFESDGCIRLSKKDIEELYSFVSTRRAYVEIVPDFAHSRLMKGQI